jgi:GTP 3',8-cyclase
MLIDPYGRSIEYVRVSVTDRCDLRCTYCLPEGFNGFEEPEHWLTFDELERLLCVMVQLGTRRIRLTGGEPLLRRNITDLAARLARLHGLVDLSISTNATQLHKHAEALKQAGVMRLNVSLDSLRAERVKAVNGRDVLPQILNNLEQARKLDFQSIKINTVAMKGVNDDEFDDLVSYCMERGFILRLIETMPIGDTGRHAHYLDLQPIKLRLQERFGLIENVLPGGGPARYLGTPDGRFNIGFITPISQHFCGTCNRVRLTVDGTLYLCLGQEATFPFRPLLREGASDVDLENAIRQAIALKPERHEFREQPQKILRFMSKTGG